MLNLEYKKIRPNTQKAMQKAIQKPDDYYTQAVETIKQYYPGEITILNSANSCILTTIEASQQPVAIPDMGGWNGVEHTCKLLNKKVVKIPTQDAIINPEKLENIIKTTDIKTLYITALGAYNKEQPINEISQICKENNILFILDITGVMGDETLTNPKLADIQLTSTGTPKIINIENGGFINNITGKIQLNQHLTKTLKADNITCAAITCELPNAHHILTKTRNANNYLKKILKHKLKNNNDYYILNSDAKYGLNTIIKTPSKSKTKKLAYKIRQHLNITPEKNIISTGPNNNRIKKPTINIEIKNLDINSLTQQNMEKLAQIIEDEIKNQQQT